MLKRRVMLLARLTLKETFLNIALILEVLKLFEHRTSSGLLLTNYNCYIVKSPQRSLCISY